MKLFLGLTLLFSFLKFASSQNINITQPSPNTSWNFCSALTICWTCVPGGSAWLLELIEKGMGNTTAYDSISVPCDDGAGSYTWFLNQTLVTGSYTLSVQYITSVASVDINIVGATNVNCTAPSEVPSGVCAVATKYSAPTSSAATSTATASQGACVNCGPNMSAIIGGAVGGVVALLIIVTVAIVCCNRWKRHQRNVRKAAMDTELATMTSRGTDAAGMGRSDKSKKSDLDNNGVNLDGSRKIADRTDTLQSHRSSHSHS